MNGLYNALSIRLICIHACKILYGKCPYYVLYEAFPPPFCQILMGAPVELYLATFATTY